MKFTWEGTYWDLIGCITNSISCITAIITIVYLVYQFHYLPKIQRRDALENLTALFMLSRGKAEKLANELLSYSVQNGCFYSDFLPNVSFHAQMMQLQHLIISDLTDEVLEKMLKMATTDYLIATAVDSLNKQILSFTQLEAHFNTVFKFRMVAQEPNTET